MRTLALRASKAFNLSSARSRAALTTTPRRLLVNLDDCWATGRDKNGRLIADPKLWTGGTLKHIADYVHSKGMLFGTYTDRGTYTCAKRPGAQGHEALDAETYASWGVE